MVFLVVKISFSGLHSIVEIFISGIIVGGGMKRVSLDCTWLKLSVIMFL